MNKSTLRICFIYLILVFAISGCKVPDNNKINATNIKYNSETDYNYKNILDKYGIEKDNIPIEGIVSNEETAIKIAEAILYQTYVEKIVNIKPFKATYDEENNVWAVNGTLAPNSIGGTTTVIIQKKDGKILAVWYRK